MDWGNAIVRSRKISATGKVESIEMELHLEGDFRKTKKKVTWLAQPTTAYKLVDVTLLDYDYLITKKKLEEEAAAAAAAEKEKEVAERSTSSPQAEHTKGGDIKVYGE